MEHISARLTIQGLVQGVGYRAFVAETANRLGLNGWVRNLLDGSVEAFLEGEETQVQQAITACRTGPARAQVEHISIDLSCCDVPEFASFNIRY